MSNVREWIAGLTALVLVPAALVAVVGVSARAATGSYLCIPHRPNDYASYYFAGANWNRSGTPGGVYADIQNYAPYVSGPDGDDVSEWVMLDDQPPSSGYWVQLGWLDSYGGARYTFDEISRGPDTYHDDYYPAYPVNSMQHYTVLYQPHSAYPFVMKVNGNEVNAEANIFRPNDAEIFTELHTASSQVPGGYRGGNEVSDAHVWPRAGSGGWQNFNGYSFTNGPGSQVPSTAGWLAETPWLATGVNRWWTWDKACAS